MDEFMNDLCWKWNCQANNDNISIDGRRERVTFCQISNEQSLQVVYGDTPLCQESFHCWTLFIEELYDSEVVFGVSIGNKDTILYTSEEDKPVTFNNSEDFWLLSNNGCVRHGLVGAIHDNWKFYQKDYITVYLNFAERKLSFAINGNHLGMECVGLPVGCSVFPVIGATKICSVRLKSTYSFSYSLELRSLLSLCYYKCSQKSRKAVEQKRFSKDMNVFWIKPVPLQKYLAEDIPIGLLSVFKVKYPCFFEKNIHRTRKSFVKKLVLRDRICAHSPPKLIFFQSDLSSEELPIHLRLSKKRKNRPNEIDSASENAKMVCTHGKCLRMYKRLNVQYSF